MNEMLLKNILLLMGNWVIMSLLAGMVVWAVWLLYRVLFPELSAKLRYQTALMSLASLLLFTLFITYLLPNFSEIFTEEPQRSVEENALTNPEILNQLTDNPANESPVAKEANDNSSYIIIAQIALGIFWLVGMFIYSIKFLGGFVYLKMLLKRASSKIPTTWQTKTQELATHLKIKADVSLRISVKVSSPLTFGFLKPVIIFPIGFFTTLPAEQIEAIILHELYHIKHKDYLLNLLVMMMEIIFFYHPLMWYLSREIQAERENACDDAVINQIQNPLNYAKALINMEEFRQIQGKLSLHFSSKHSQINHRVMRLFSNKPSKAYSIKPFLGLICLSFFLMSFTLLNWGNSEINELVNSDVSEKVHFKVTGNNNESVISVKENSLITKAGKENISFYLDDKKLDLNSTYYIQYTELLGMIRTKDDTEYRVYSIAYVSQKGNSIFSAREENDVIHRFHTNADNNITTELKDKAITESSEQNDGSKETDKTSFSTQNIVQGPINFVKKDNMHLKEFVQIEKIERTMPNSLKKNNLHNIMHGNLKQDTTKLNTKNANFQTQTDSILIVLNGNVLGIGGSRISGLDHKYIASFTVLGGEEAKVKYSNTAINKAVEITTNDDFSQQQMDLFVESFHAKGVGKDNDLVIMDGEKGPLFYVDGEPTLRLFLSSLDPNNIKKIEVLKGEKAIDKYGKKAKYGVVEIYTKKGN